MDGSHDETGDPGEKPSIMQYGMVNIVVITSNGFPHYSNGWNSAGDEKEGTSNTFFPHRINSRQVTYSASEWQYSTTGVN